MLRSLRADIHAAIPFRAPGPAGRRAYPRGLVVLAALILQAALAAAAPATSTVGPEPSFRIYGMPEGLPSSDIDALAQDRDGYLWISTESGLARYGGGSFRVWRHDPRDPKSVSAVPQANLFVDDDGQLWGGSQDGLLRYDRAHDNFSHWHHDPADPASPSSDDVSAFARTPGGSLWVGHFDTGVDRLRPDGRGFDHLRQLAGDPDSLVSDTIYALLAEANGDLWIGARGGLDRRLPDGRLQHVPFDRPGDAHPDKPLRVYRLARVGDTLMIATNYGLYGLDPTGPARLVAPDQLPQQAVFSLATDLHGRLWVGTSDGLYVRHTDGHYQHIAAHPLLRQGLPDAFIAGLLLDHEGGLWIGTTNGLVYLSPDWGDFSFYTHVPDVPDSLGPGVYNAVTTHGNDHLWVADDNGALDRLDLTTGKVQHLPFRMPQNRFVYSMAEDARGRLWFGSNSGVFRLEDGKVSELQAPMPEQIEFGDDGTAYFQLPDSIIAIAPDGPQMRPLALDPQASNVNIYDTEWRDHALWISSDAGLMRWAPGDPHARLVPGVRPGQATRFDLNGPELWVLNDENLSHYHLDGNQASLRATYPLYLAHPIADVLSLHADRSGKLWFFARSGLWRYDPTTGQVREFGLEQGLGNGEFTNVSISESPDGHVYAATKTGVVGFVPEAVMEKQRMPRVLLETVSVRRNGKLQRLDGRHGRWRLNWNDRDLSVTARAVSYIAPERNRYRFRLDGLDSDWVDNGPRGERSFTQLPSGDYTLQVQAAGPDGEWGSLATPLQIHVDQAPWLRWWAWLVYALLLALLFIALLLAMRRRQQRRHQLELLAQQHRLAHAASDAKTRFLAELGHEIRTPMTGVLGMAELLLTRSLPPIEHGYVQTIQRSGEVMLTLVNSALDLARIEAGQLQLTIAPVDPRMLLQDVAALQAGRASAKGLALHVESGDDVPGRVLADAVRLKQILLNLSGNALKFTEHGEVRLSVTTQSGGLLFVVADTGPGIEPRDQERLFRRYEQLDGPQRSSGSGLGLAICRELVTLMGGSITLDSAPGRGSRFQVYLPLPAVAVAAAEADASAAAPATAAPSRGAQSVLLLEDDPVIAEVIGGLLRDQGRQVQHAVNGLQALQLLDTHAFDVALVDLDLPGVDGFQWARLARRHPRGASLPLIAITARSGGDEEALARHAGMNSFLRKPLSGAQLAESLDAVPAHRPPPNAPD